jgi:amino acid transporter
MMWGWLGVGCMVMVVGAALAEVTSAYPTAGALSHMACVLGGPRWGYFTGWLNLLGLLGGLAGGAYGAALFTGAWLNLQWGLTPTPGRTLGILAVILLLLAGLNLFGVRLVGVLNSISVWWHLTGVALITGALIAVPSHHQSAGFVFTHFANNTGRPGPLHVAALGLLLAQYTLSGHDACAHLSEETRQAQVSAGRGIVHSILWSWAAGFVLLAGLTFAIQDYPGTIGSATGVPPAQIFLDALGERGAKALLLVVIVAQLFCVNAGLACASRMVFASSRDAALPFSGLWRRVSSRTRTPVPAVWLSAAVPFVLALPSLYSGTAYYAAVAVSVIGITPAYAIPVYLRLRAGDRFTPGPWHLGRWSRPIGWTAVTWAALITVVLCLPRLSPVTPATFNYAPLALAALLLLATARRLTRGRRRHDVPVYGSAAERAEFARDIV